MIVQFLRFGAVGAAATLVHVVLYVAFVEAFSATPVVSNALAFAVAVTVSFAGHASWSFRHEYRGRSSASYVLFSRFVISALLGLSLNTLFVFILVTTLGLDYPWAIPCFVFVTPVILYLVNRLWVFA